MTDQDSAHGRLTMQATSRRGHLVALTGLGTALGVVTLLLVLRTGGLVSTLPSPRLEVYVEILVVVIGALVAAWVSLTATLAAVCVLAERIGTRWRLGETMVRRHAPAAVRRLARLGVTATVGAGLVLGGSTAHASTPHDPSQQEGQVAVDLGWVPTVEAVQAVAGSGPGPTAASVPSPEPTPDPSGEPSPKPSGGPAADTTAELSVDRTEDSSDDRSTETAPVPTGDTAVDGSRATPDQSTTSIPEESAAGARSTKRDQVTPTPGQQSTTERTAAPADTSTRGTESRGEVVVLRGDTLWSIARAALEPAAEEHEVAVEVRRWFEANRDVIGDDPDLILPGQILAPPR
ncbi:LysM peptidoglycan-binding domain-containing protein [Oerskovia flava]|uniref:LysM peptidoglycan-binding domain-containing protein n=1 Tax=Oerskovia flava TaxID=2986422 RepID=UPI00223FA22E|nr:hypothetical protein [Oerskovia sp. JB1-3-2]